MLALEPYEMTCGEQVAWLDAMQSISMAMGGGPLAVQGRCCNRGDWKPEYDGEKLHVSRPQLIAAMRKWCQHKGPKCRPIAQVSGWRHKNFCMRSDMQIARIY